MVERDVVVGVIAIGVGLAILGNLLIRRSAPVKLNSVRFIEKRLGPVGSKIFLATLGLFLAAIGIFLIVQLPSVDKFVPPNEDRGNNAIRD